MTRTRIKTWTVLLAIAAFAMASTANAAEWGSVKGRFVLDGPPPVLPPLNLGTDAVCHEPGPKNEVVMVDDNGGLANVVVYIRVGRGKKLDVHPDYAASLSEPAVLDNHGCSFVPHVVLVRTGQQFVIKNSDPTGHNTNAKLQKNGAFNVLIAQGDSKPMTFSKSEALPMPVNCNIHTFMTGYVLVQDHPYMAASSADGTFEIKNIPAGKQEFQVWHEVPGRLKNVKFSGGSLDRQGRADLTIKAGETLDLGDIKVPSSLLTP